MSNSTKQLSLTALHGVGRGRLYAETSTYTDSHPCILIHAEVETYLRGIECAHCAEQMK